MATGIDVCNKAREFIGYPYVYGGSSPTSMGFDCSGLVQYSYKLCGISIPRTTYDQIKIGTKIIDKSKVDKVWDQFYRDEAANSSRIGSSGLGLAITKNILILHKAQYGCYSGLGETTFWFEMKKSHNEK